MTHSALIPIPAAVACRCGSRMFPRQGGKHESHLGRSAGAGVASPPACKARRGPLALSPRSPRLLPPRRRAAAAWCLCSSRAPSGVVNRGDGKMGYWTRFGRGAGRAAGRPVLLPSLEEFSVSATTTRWIGCPETLRRQSTRRSPPARTASGLSEVGSAATRTSGRSRLAGQHGLRRTAPPPASISGNGPADAARPTRAPSAR